MDSIHAITEVVLQAFSKIILVYLIFRQEKEGLLSEAVESFNEALGLDNDQRTAKEHLVKVQQQLELTEQVGHLVTNSMSSLCKIKDMPFHVNERPDG